MIISLRLSEIDGELVKMSAMNQGLSVSSFIRRVLLERIECDFRETMQKVEVMRKDNSQTA
ncbi:MAG: CopG family transcriptional regulator [Lachnospiraceae bacterium]|nr:CopG family transcriptional regulator [Lachnospiraceae bacterium]